MAQKRRTSRLTLVFAGAFFVALIVVIAVATMPATVLASRLPTMNPDLSMRGAEGSVWNGSGRIAFRAVDLGTLNWQVDPWSLITFSPQASLALAADSHRASGVVRIPNQQQLEIDDLQFEMTAERLRQLQVVDFGTLLGQLSGHFRRVRFDQQSGLTQLVGEARWHDAGWQSDIVVRLSDLEVIFPPGLSSPVGDVRDLGGPLQVQGTIQFSGRQAMTRLELLSRGQDARIDEALNWIGQPTANGGRYLEINSAF